MPDVQFNRYYRYDELTQLLAEFEREYPGLVQIQSIGKSYEGRDIWVLAVTNEATGAASEKPALWVDGNIHASEVSASTACLHLLHRLTSEYMINPDITRCLDTRAFYICPRINPDGAEWALADVPKIIRSSTRPYPFDEDALEGLAQEDVDDDGRMLQMRIADANGQWKAHPDDPRLLVRRDPTEVGGQYYRVVPEGFVKNFDGVTLKMQPRKQGLDLNRNFPSEWRQEYEQYGAGPFPTSEPEIHAVVAFTSAHLNITGAITFHTYSGVLLRPYGTRSDEAFPVEDLWTFQKIGQKGTDITGYPNISVFHDFKYHPKEVITGVFDDWMYEHFGVYAWTVEIWSPQRQAGIEQYKFIDWSREHPIEDDFKMLKWSDEKLGGKGFVDWYEFDHPQLGRVELGGWNAFYAFRNPPLEFLENEISRFADWLIWHALISPRLELHSVTATPLGNNHYQVQIVVDNSGWLPTAISRKALEKKAVRGIIAEIELPENAVLLSGKEREDLGQLEGRNQVGVSVSSNESSGVTDHRAKMVWTIYAPNKGMVKLTAHHQRGGVVRAEINLT